MWRVLSVVSLVFLGACSVPAPVSLYYWRTTLDWTDEDSRKLQDAGVDQLGLRLFDWGTRGMEGALMVRSPVPVGLEVVPIVYITTARLEAWATNGANDGAFDAVSEARTLLDQMDGVLARAWPGSPLTWQLDADWTARTRDRWFAVAGAFRALVADRGGRFEVTVRLHQYRDRVTQGVPPADGGVLMLYGSGEKILDPALVEAYVRGPGYPIPLVPAFPSYVQVRQLNGYGRLVALHRLGAGGILPLADLEPRGPHRYEVVRRSSFGGRPLMARDVLAIDRVDPEDLARVAALPGVVALRAAAKGRVWWFDYQPDDKVPRLY